MLYTSAFLAERYAGIRAFLESKVRTCADLLSAPFPANAIVPYSWSIHVQAQIIHQACIVQQTPMRPSGSQASSRGCLLQGKNVSRDSLASDSRMERVTAAILSGVPQYSAADAFDAFTELIELTAAARVEMARVDFLVVPSAAHHYTVAGGVLLA